MSERDLLGVVPALAIHDSEFALGLRYGRESYEKDYEGETLTDVEVMQFIEKNLSHTRHEHKHRFGTSIGLRPISYAYHVGFVVGWLGALMGSASLPSSSLPMFCLVRAQSVVPSSLCAMRHALTASWLVVGGDLC